MTCEIQNLTSCVYFNLCALAELQVVCGVRMRLRVWCNVCNVRNVCDCLLWWLHDCLVCIICIRSCGWVIYVIENFVYVLTRCAFDTCDCALCDYLLRWLCYISDCVILCCAVMCALAGLHATVMIMHSCHRHYVCARGIALCAFDVHVNAYVQALRQRSQL